MRSALFATKSIAAIAQESGEATGLRRSLGFWDLLFLGVGGVVGTGVFVLTGQVAAANAGPAVTLSFLVSAVAASLAGLCYAEMASMIPLAGSAYTYAYATLGELIAFAIGWDLILEYGVAAATVSVGWSGYFTSLLRHSVGIELPPAWAAAPLTYDAVAGHFSRTDAILNLPAAAIVGCITCLLIVGMRLSMRVITYVVFVKLGVIGIFLLTALPHVDAANWQPFFPPNTGHFGSFGISGMLQAATILFFAYCGFDAVSTAAQECKRPQRDLPLGMIASLGIATLLYALIALALTGVLPYQKLGVPDPMAAAMAATGQTGMAALVDVGAVAALASVMLVQIYGQTRILFAMSRDGLLPARLTAVHSSFGTPAVLTAWIGGLAALAGGVLPIELLGELTSIGTLFAFVVVSLGVVLLRYTQPETQRPFKVPFGPLLLPLSSVAVSGGLLCTATPPSMLRLVLWMLAGFTVYGVYGRKHSRLRRARLAAAASRVP